MFLLLGAGFFLVSCTSLGEVQGHWSVEELNAGYLEFTIKNDSMVVCSPRHGLLYKGRIEVKSGRLIQYNNDQFPKGGNSGRIKEVTDSTMVLVYDDTIVEHCKLLSRDVLRIDGTCFPGSVGRMNN